VSELGSTTGELISEAVTSAMTDKSTLFTTCRRLLAAAILFTAAATTGAVAQNVVAMVNGEPITALDIEQRSKFIQLSTQKTPPRQEILDELIDEKLKVREAKRWGIEVSDADVEASYTGMATRMRLNSEQLTQSLARSGVNAATLKARIKADLTWQNLVRGRYQSSLQFSDKEILSAMESKNIEDKDTVAYDYLMRPILLLVPPGSAQPVVDGRIKEAEALRGRFKGCEEGLGIARTFRDVAIRDQITRTSSDLPAELRKVLEAIPVGQLTAPEVTRLGVEMYAICSRSESKADTPGKRQAREAVFAERFEQQSKAYLQRIRREALIERR
jgi:peptidyl-prolyl cis-trans isomerase SurA